LEEEDSPDPLLNEEGEAGRNVGLGLLSGVFIAGILAVPARFAKQSLIPVVAARRAGYNTPVMGLDLNTQGPDPGPASGGGETFRLPSTALFLGLLPVFSGHARRGDLAAELVDDGRPRLDARGALRPTQQRTYIVYSGRESEARTSVSLFKDDPLWQEGELSALIKRQFGPAGLKHLLGVFIAAEESAGLRPGFPGAFVFDVNKHLDVLAYKRANRVNGKAYHTTRHLAEAREIVALLCSLTIVQEIRLGARRGMTVRIRLLLDEAAAESWEDVTDGVKLRERIMTNERLYLRLNPHLFSLAAEGTRQQRVLYTHQLKRLARENAHSQALTLTLGVHLPIKFRLGACEPLRYTARAFLRMAGIPDEEYTVYEQLERLEKTLRYMVDQDYVSAFETPRYRYAPDERTAPDAPLRPDHPPRGRLVLKTKEGRYREDPLDEDWQVEPPAFLKQLLAAAPVRASGPGLPALSASSPPSYKGGPGGVAAAGAPAVRQPTLPGLEIEGAPPHAGELLRQVRVKLALSQSQLARMLGYTQAAISMAEAGRRPQMARRLFEAARRIRPDPQPEPFQGKPS
jgi:hypothetical protein